MSPISWVLVALVGLFSLVLIGITIYYSIAPNPYKVLEGTTGIYGPLNQQLYVGNNADVTDNFVKSGEGSLSVYIYLDPMQRTSVLSGSSQDQGINIFNLGNVLTFMEYPSGASGIQTAEIAVQTATENGDTQIERFPVKALPKQQWIFVTISRRGRRFTVYYNNKPVTSFRTAKYPVSNSVSWSLGDARSSGYWAYPQVTEYALTESEIVQRSSRFADTRGSPILPKPGFKNILGAFGGCPNGIFCFNPPTVPIAPLDAWSSPFA